MKEQWNEGCFSMCYVKKIVLIAEASRCVTRFNKSICSV